VVVQRSIKNSLIDRHSSDTLASSSISLFYCTACCCCCLLAGIMLCFLLHYPVLLPCTTLYIQTCINSYISLDIPDMSLTYLCLWLQLFVSAWKARLCEATGSLRLCIRYRLPLFLKLMKTHIPYTPITMTIDYNDQPSI
jgi:hypothetical protein